MGSKGARKEQAQHPRVVSQRVVWFTFGLQSWAITDPWGLSRRDYRLRKASLLPLTYTDTKQIARTFDLKDHHMIGLLWRPNHSWILWIHSRVPASFVYPHPSSHLTCSAKASLTPPAQGYLFLLLLLICSWSGTGHVPAVISKYLSVEGRSASSPPGTNCLFLIRMLCGTWLMLSCSKKQKTKKKPVD